MKSNIFHTRYVHHVLVGCLLLTTSFGKAQSSSNTNGFEANSVGTWTGSAGSESVAINSSVVRTGSYSLALTTSNAASNRSWYSNNPYAASAVGSYVHFIFWAKSLASTASVDASMRYTTTSPPSGAGTSVTGNSFSINNTAWTQVYFNTGNVNSRYYFAGPRKTSSTATTVYTDDMVIYTSSSSTTDLISPNFPINASGNSASGLKWTNGSDNGEGATGVQKTLIFKRTAGSVGASDLVLNNQGVYSLTSTIGPSTVGNWTLVAESVSSTASSYSTGTFTVGTEYAIVHRDLAYNYSMPTYVVITAPAPKLSIKEVSSGTYYSSGGSFKIGTFYSSTSVSKTFKIYNTGTGVLNISSATFSDGTKYSITSAPASSIASNDSTQITIQFASGSSNGNFTDILNISSNDATTPAFSLNFVGAKADFVLPYTYQAGTTSPIYSNSELKQDFTYTSDIPSEFSIGSGSAFGSTHFYTNYNSYLNEGNCVPSSNSALRIGQGSYRLKMNLSSCGIITAKWCAGGYRKIRISDASGKIYEQSVNYLGGGSCYTTSAIVNTASPVTVYVEFLANDTNLLTSLYYLNITPYNASVKNTAKSIYEFSSGIAGEKVNISANSINVEVPIGTNLTAIAPSLIKTSPNAGVSPAQGVSTNFTNPVNYVVTAEDGSTKTYSISIKEAVNYTSSFYADSILIPIDMNEADKKIEVIEVSNSSCQVPVSGNGASYTIYFLDSTDMPAGGYEITGASNICIGSTASYSISNAPNSNSPKYTWRLGGTDKNLFTIVGDSVSETFKIKAPDHVSSSALDISINVVFSPSSCTLLEGKDTVSINVSTGTPEPITSLSADCVVNDLLTITALGSSDATSYNWSFVPSQSVITQSGNSIVINVSNTSDITAYVNTQSACGITVNSTPFDVEYGTTSSTWTGSIDSNWNKNGNWTGRIPKACTNVIIPDVSSGISYPTITGNGICNSITFKSGGAVLGLQNLTYQKAYVDMNLQRMKWYTLTAPLKNMFSGDYYTTGKPRTQAKLFDDVNPDKIGDTIAVGTWTNSFANLAVPFTPGMGFAFLVDTFSYNYPYGTTSNHADKTFSFPIRNSDGSLVSSLYPYSGVTGKVYTNLPISLAKDSSIAYRFAMENSANKLVDIQVPIKAGLNLIGNPLMTHLDFNKLYLSNSGKISNNVKFWNGTTFVTYMAGDDITSSLDLSNTNVPPMQAFFVYGNPSIAAGTTLNIDLEDHFVADNSSKLRAAKALRPNTLHIKSSENGLISWAAVAIKQGANNGYSSDDAFKLFSNNRNAPDVYTIADSHALDINQFGKLPYITPLNIKSNAKGTVSLDFIGAESFENIEVYILNTETGERQNIKENNKININNKGTGIDGSLFLEFRNASISTNLKTTENYKNTINVNTKNGILYVQSDHADPIKKITLWDELGKLLYQNTSLNSASFDIALNNKNVMCLCSVETEHNTRIVKLLVK